MARGTKMDRRGSGPMFVVLLLIVVYVLYAVTMALATADRCEGRVSEWRFFPPGYVC